MTKEKEKDWQTLERAELQELLANRGFRRFCQKVMRICGTDGHGYVPGSFDATAFNCGQKSIGIMLKAWIMDADPAGKRLFEMHCEWLEDMRQRTAADIINDTEE